MTLCAGDRCAPSRCGLAKPTTPTNKKTTPKILQIVFAICDPLLCQSYEPAVTYPRVGRVSALQAPGVVRLMRRMYTRESGCFAKFFADAGDILFAKLFNLRGAI